MEVDKIGDGIGRARDRGKGVQSGVQGAQSGLRNEVTGLKADLKQGIRKPVSAGGPAAITRPAVPDTKSYDFDAT